MSGPDTDVRYPPRSWHARAVSEQRLRSGDSAGQDPAPTVGEIVYDYGTGHWSWSPDMYAVLGVGDDGRPPDALLSERMYPTDRAAVLDSLERAVRTGGAFAGQYRIRDDGGRERSVAFVGDVENDDDGRPVRLRGLGFDVSRAARVAATEAVAAATADRAAIEQVKGALMFAYGLDEQAAFGLLSRYSQRGNVKLGVVARRVADLLADQGEPGTEQSLLRVLEHALGSVVRPERDLEADAG